ncbi:MAG: alanine racemase [Clostridiales bacterium]|nr:alanine racemase [Clostridiales bacterium]
MLNKAIINLKNLEENAKFIKSKLNGKKFFAVLKADGYGHGAVKCANAIYSLVDGYAVCLLEEGLLLRRAGIDKEILILTRLFDKDIFQAVFYSFTITVSSLKEIKKLEKEGKFQGKLVKVHIKYNTGMNRQGVDGEKELIKLLDYIKTCEFVKLTGFYSHLIEPSNDKITKMQVERFDSALKIVKKFDGTILAHLSSSGGFLKGLYYDMVRVGLLLYGYSPFNKKIKGINPVMSVKSFVVDKRVLKKGDYLLYGKEKVKKDCKVYLVRFGYADGLFRKKSVGDIKNRCMDLSAVSTKRDKNSKEFYILYKNAYYLAKKYDTIVYEILVNIAKRAEKVYL